MALLRWSYAAVCDSTRVAAAQGISALAACCAACALLACGPVTAPADADTQSVCGRHNELQDVQLYDGSLGVSTGFVNRHKLAVGLLRWRSDLSQRYFDEAGNVSGEGWCTGTLIDDDLFLTAGHCLDSEDHGSWTLPHDKGGVALRPTELAREFVVDFRYELAERPELPPVVNRADVVRLEEYRNGDLDYAILRLSDHPGLRNGVTPISPRTPAVGSAIAILQHPAATPMKIAAGAVSGLEGSKISYGSIDTLGGSSGAGIVDAVTGKLVGVHTNGGCSKTSGENYGVTMTSLITVSPELRRLADFSRDFLVGDWDADGLADLAVFDAGCLYPDANHDGEPDAGLPRCPLDRDANEYFVGRWELGQPSGLGWRRRGCVYLDRDPHQPLCFGGDNDRFEILVLDWNEDGRSDLGVRRANCFAFDTNLDGALDTGNYCYGKGSAEDEYLAGPWDGKRDSIAVREGNSVLIDLNRDGTPDETRVYGNGGNEDQYLVGDWSTPHDANLAVRRKTSCFINHDANDGVADEVRVYRDFWNQP